MSLREQLFDSLILGFERVPFDEYFMYKVERVSREGKPEVFYFEAKDLARVVDDLIDEHPRIWEYRVAQNILMDQERYIHRPDREDMSQDRRMYKTDYRQWDKVRNALIDPSKGTGTPIVRALRAMGPNPTMRLYDEASSSPEETPSSSKFRSNLLMNNLWRTKSDFEAKKGVRKIKEEMYEQILTAPVKAVQDNRYVYSAIRDYATITK